MLPKAAGLPKLCLAPRGSNDQAELQAEVDELFAPPPQKTVHRPLRCISKPTRMTIAGARQWHLVAQERDNRLRGDRPDYAGRDANPR